MSETTPASFVRAERQGRLGLIVLDRPKALHALTLPMIRDLHAALRQHEADPQVATILIRSTTPKAFCAGGDMRAIRELALAGRHDEAMAFFGEEYALNLAIAACPKPYIAWLDGIAMGGGLGLSVHGRYRVVTERSLQAMPEAAIGFFPDVGGTYFLPRLPFEAGWWLGLTGVRFDGAEALALGLATHRVDSADEAALMAALADGAEPVEAVLARHARPLGDDEAATLKTRHERRAQWFASHDLAATDAALAAAAAAGGAEIRADAQHLLDELRFGSPTALRLTVQLYADCAGLSLADCLDRELVAARQLLDHPDLAEGVRAVMVDKDRQPRWAAV